MQNPEIYPALNKLEQTVADWLEKNRVIFQAQEPFFGATLELGGVTVDFLLPDRNIVIRVQGTHWHQDLAAEARDLLAKEKLIETGFQVVDIWDTQLTEDKIENTMRKAIQGEEIPR